MKIGNFSGKGKMLEIFQRILKLFENRGRNLKQGECIMVSGGMDAPGYYYAYPCKFHSINLVLELLLSQTYFNDNLQLNWLFKQFSTLTRNRNNYTSSLAKYGGLIQIPCMAA